MGLHIQADQVSASYAPTSATLTIASHTNTAATFAGLPNTLFVSSGVNRTHPASTVLVWPFVVTDPITITDWTTKVTVNTSASTETLRAGIYNLSAGYVVGSLVLEFPTLTVPTGTGLYVTALSSPLNLASGRYAIAWNVSATTFSLKTPQAAFGALSMPASNNAPARFLTGSNGSSPIANPLPDPVPTPQLAIATDVNSWGPSVLPVWSYT